MFMRVAKFVAGVEGKWDDDADTDASARQFYDMMASREFMPNTPTLVNSGKPGGQLSACFVLPIEDSTRSIYKTLGDAAAVQTSGGGTGFSGARLRSNGSVVGSTGKKSGGNIPVLKLYNSSSKEFITQGSARRGANMWVLPVWHADIEEFITCKDKDGEIAEFNISVGITDAFMTAVNLNHVWSLLDPKDKRVVKVVQARELFERIVEHAWLSGDPGLVFLDTMNKDNPTPALGDYEATNPCGEQPLLPYEACTLGHLNLGLMLNSRDPKVSGPTQRVDWEKITYTTRVAVRFLDNVVELNGYPLPEIAAMHRDGNRKIGVGVMGWHDMLAQLGVPYDSEAARSLATDISRHIRKTADEESVNLASFRGSYNNFKGSRDEAKFTDKRNACTTTIAPTGTSGTIAAASGGIEPIFGLVIVRNQAGMVMTEVHPAFNKWLDQHKVDNKQAVIEYVKQNGGVKGCPHLSTAEQGLWVQANDISVDGHVLMQAAWQKNIDSAVSKTINLPNKATKEDVRHAYLTAYQTGCKGITIYRDGSKSGQVLEVVKKTDAVQTNMVQVQPNSTVWAVWDPNELATLVSQQPATVQVDLFAKLGVELIPPTLPDVIEIGNAERSRVTQGAARKIPTGCGNAFIFIGNGPDGKIDDIMGRLGKSGGCASAWWEGMCRVTSLALRSGVDADELRKQLSGISCHLPTMYPDSPLRNPGEKPRQVTSCSDALANAIAEHLVEVAAATEGKPEAKVIPMVEASSTVSVSIPMQGNAKVIYVNKQHAGACPSCGSSNLDHGGGCLMCHNCGFSRC
jgi:ribonucleoside-diphosphate reductase alpha chain